MIDDLDIKNLPEEVTTTVYLSWSYEYEWANVYAYPPTDDDDRCLIAEPLEVTFKVKTSEDAINNTVTELKKKIQEIRAKSEAQCNAIEEKIQSYLALPNLGE